MVKKDKQLIEDAEKNGTPVFVLSAKDDVSYFALEAYYNHCVAAKCTKVHCDAVMERIKEFTEWQTSNPDKVKLPD